MIFLRNEQIPHEGAEAGAVLTVSLGVHTAIPAHGDELLPFIETADRQLYQAKRDRKGIATSS